MSSRFSQPRLGILQGQFTTIYGMGEGIFRLGGGGGGERPIKMMPVSSAVPCQCFIGWIGWLSLLCV